MAQDVLSVLVASPDIEGFTLLSDDPEVRRLAGRFGGDFLLETELGATGLNAVVTAAVSRLARTGIGELLILHGDLPMLSADDIATMAASHAALGERAVTIATDRHGTGTNCLLLSPPGGFVFRFGENSRLRHEQAARDSGRSCRVLELPGAALDVDTPEDLAVLRNAMSADARSRTARCLAEFEAG